MTYTKMRKAFNVLDRCRCGSQGFALVAYLLILYVICFIDYFLV